MASRDTHNIDLMALGQHCSVAGCHQLDFLPITCARCKVLTCSDHGPPRMHHCANMAAGDVRSIIVTSRNTAHISSYQRVVTACPLCSQLVNPPPSGRSLNDQMEQHIASGCVAHVASQGRGKHVCAVKGCRNRDGAHVAVTCSACRRQLCLAHRFPEHHACHAISAH